MRSSRPVNDGLWLNHRRLGRELLQNVSGDIGGDNASGDHGRLQHEGIRADLDPHRRAAAQLAPTRLRMVALLLKGSIVESRLEMHMPDTPYPPQDRGGKISFCGRRHATSLHDPALASGE